MSRALEVLSRKEEVPTLPSGARVNARSVAALYTCTVAKSTSISRLSKLNSTAPPAKRGPPTQISPKEEDVCIEVLRTRADRGYPMFREDLEDMVQEIFNTWPVEKQSRVKFKDGRPSGRPGDK